MPYTPQREPSMHDIDRMAAEIAGAFADWDPLFAAVVLRRAAAVLHAESERQRGSRRPVRRPEKVED